MAAMIKKITAKSFRPYGRIIEYPNKHLKGNKRNLFRIVLTEKNRCGWRIAYLIVRDKTIKRLESHPYSFESFEPLTGRSLIYVTKKMDTRSIQCFELDRPIILNKGIWHGVVTLNDESEMKLTENANVKCVYWALGYPLPGNQKTI